MKVIIFNLNVGGSVEYSGEIIKSWIPTEVFDLITIADPDADFSQELVDASPDIVILNDASPKFCQVVADYKANNVNTKVVLLFHNWKMLMDTYVRPDYMDNIVAAADSIFVVNGLPGKLPINLEKVEPFYYPTPSSFVVTTAWKDRQNMFCFIGNILPHKMSVEFVDKIKETEIVIDCYGTRWDGVKSNLAVNTGKVLATPTPFLGQSIISSEGSVNLSEWVFDSKIVMPAYYEKYDGSSFNLKDMGAIPQDQVASVLNQYKYIVIPHDGFESFNWTILQAMFCGTIPLIVNNRNQTAFDSTWIDWAQGLYYGCNTVDEMISNLQLIIKDSIDRSQISELISMKVAKKFNYGNFKNRFVEVLNSFAGINKEV